MTLPMSSNLQPHARFVERFNRGAVVNSYEIERVVMDAHHFFHAHPLRCFDSIQHAQTAHRRTSEKKGRKSQPILAKSSDSGLKPDMNKVPQTGRLIRPRLAGFEVTGDTRRARAKRVHGSMELPYRNLIPPQGSQDAWVSRALAHPDTMHGGDEIKTLSWQVR
jgi:hypothetical protein